MRDSNPIREGLIRIRIIGPRHLGQLWNGIAMRLESRKTAGDGMSWSFYIRHVQSVLGPADAVWTIMGTAWRRDDPGAVLFCSLLEDINAFDTRRPALSEPVPRHFDR